MNQSLIGYVSCDTLVFIKSDISALHFSCGIKYCPGYFKISALQVLLRYFEITKL